MSTYLATHSGPSIVGGIIGCIVVFACIYYLIHFLRADREHPWVAEQRRQRRAAVNQARRDNEDRRKRADAERKRRLQREKQARKQEQQEKKRAERERRQNENIERRRAKEELEMRDRVRDIEAVVDDVRSPDQAHIRNKAGT